MTSSNLIDTNKTDQVNQSAHLSKFDLSKPESQMSEKNFPVYRKLSSSFPDNLESLAFKFQKK